jgi:hypothetical protein
MILEDIWTPELQEYEVGTTRTREIEQTLRTAGYRKLGSGAEATVWTRDDGGVIKIIMPDPTSTQGSARTFRDFFRLTQAVPSPHWPRFLTMRDQGGRASQFAKFEIQGRPYTQVAMERLKPLSRTEGSIVDSLEFTVRRGRRFRRALEHLQMFPEYQRWVQNNIGQLKTFYQTLQASYTQRPKRYTWDIHSGNVMKRADGTLVITDPWINWKS